MEQSTKEIFDLLPSVVILYFQIFNIGISTENFTDTKAILQEMGTGAGHASMVEETKIFKAEITLIWMSALMTIFRAFHFLKTSV